MSEADAAAPAAEKTKAKKAKAKAKKAKPAKKAAKKAAKGNGATRARFNPDHKIQVLVRDNPRRKGSAAHDRLEKVLKSGGKSVKAFLDGGGRSATLGFAVENKLVKVG